MIHSVKWLPLCAGLCFTALLQAQELQSPPPTMGQSTAADTSTTIKLETLAGPLPKLVRADHAPYLVISDIEVPANRTVIIEPGTVFLFRNFCGLHIHGRLIAEGSKSDPIIFSSEFDRSFNPLAERFANPYDWNGVYVHPDGFGTRLAFCKVHYSVYGVVSETKFVRIDPLQLQRNGKQVLTIENAEYKASDKGEYRWVLEAKDAVVDGVPVDILKDPLARRRNLFRYLGLAAFLGGCAAGTYQVVREMPESQAAFEARQSDKPENTVPNNNSLWQSAKQQRDKDRLLCAAGYAVGLLGAVGFVWTLSF